MIPVRIPRIRIRHTAYRYFSDVRHPEQPTPVLSWATEYQNKPDIRTFPGNCAYTGQISGLSLAPGPLLTVRISGLSPALGPTQTGYPVYSRHLDQSGYPVYSRHLDLHRPDSRSIPGTWASITYIIDWRWMNEINVMETWFVYKFLMRRRLLHLVYI